MQPIPISTGYLHRHSDMLSFFFWIHDYAFQFICEEQFLFKNLTTTKVQIRKRVVFYNSP